jgi:hypothetical protein
VSEREQPDPGEGWLLLEAGDVIEAGDVYECGNGHDWDNYCKAAVDTASYYGITSGDSAAHFRGPASDLSGIYACAHGAVPFAILAFVEVEDGDSASDSAALDALKKKHNPRAI